MKIAFIGLGIMGKPMALNLLKAGHELRVYDINQDTITELKAAGAVACASSAETVQGVVIANVNQSSSAAEEGLQRGDIIVSVNQQPVKTPQEAANVVAAARKANRDTVLLFVQRGNTPGRFVGVKVQ